jgi:hypothetical protein
MNPLCIDKIHLNDRKRFFCFFFFLIKIPFRCTNTLNRPVLTRKICSIMVSLLIERSSPSLSK